jgi:superfamily II DNA/RNA helicase
LDKSEQVPERIAVSIVHSPEKDKLQTLLNLVCVLGQQSSLVFVNYRESVERVGDYLKKNGVNVDVFHGGMEQRDRERALFRFCNGSCNVFVSTDLASRGLDIPQVDNIIH